MLVPEIQDGGVGMASFLPDCITMRMTIDV